MSARRQGLGALAAGTLLTLTGGCAKPAWTGQAGHSSPLQAPREAAVADAPHAPATPTSSAPRSGAPPPPLDVTLVERAAAPWHAVERRRGLPLTPEQLFDRLESVSAVCAGERHPEARDHYAQLALLAGLEARAEASGRQLGVGLEMLSPREQPALDAFVAGELPLTALPAQVEWQARWGYDFSLYHPIFALAGGADLTLLALNAPRSLTRRVAQVGLEGLTAAEAHELPALALDDRAHRALFDAATRAHPAGDPQRRYSAQVVWDETMAERAHAWLEQRSPARQLLLLAGLYHCAEPAIPQRLRRRGTERVASVAVAGATAEPWTDSYDYLIVFED